MTFWETYKPTFSGKWLCDSKRKAKRKIFSDFVSLDTETSHNHDREHPVGWMYQWLDDVFERYTEEILDMDTAKEMAYLNLCRAHLRKFKDPTDKDAGDEILKWMKVLKLDQFKENKQSDTEKFIERMAWNIENTKPCECEDLNKYKDFSGFEPTWKDILRCCKNLVGGTREYPSIEPERK